MSIQLFLPVEYLGVPSNTCANKPTRTVNVPSQTGESPAHKFLGGLDLFAFQTGLNPLPSKEFRVLLHSLYLFGLADSSSLNLSPWGQDVQRSNPPNFHG